MGMFDEVICEMPLPDGWEHPVFQTKDFEDPYLDKYVIRADGRLIRKKPWYESDIKADTALVGAIPRRSLAMKPQGES